MSYESVLLVFWEKVKESADNKRFAKMTMAKTIGKPNLKNIFLRPVYSENEFKVLLKLRYRSREMEDPEELLNLKDAFEVVKKHLEMRSFSSIILFDINKDVTFKINKKGAGNITEAPPSFSDVIEAESESE